MSNELTVSFSDLKSMGQVIADSKLFGVKTANEAIALMLVAQAEGLHPAIAARDYHIIQGRPSLKADAMLSRFQTAGGSVEWHELSDLIADATFSHPKGGKIRMSWDKKRAEQAQLIKCKDNWEKYPRAMLRARLISEAIRTIFPACVSGFYTPEEIEDISDDKNQTTQQPKKTEQKKAEQKAEQSAPPKTEVNVLNIKLDAFEYKTEELNGRQLHVLSSPDGDFKTSDSGLGEKIKALPSSHPITATYQKVKDGLKLLSVQAVA